MQQDGDNNRLKVRLQNLQLLLIIDSLYEVLGLDLMLRPIPW